MISVLLLGCQGPDGQSLTPGAVVRTLAALVPATVEGLVRDVALLCCRDDQALADVADHAGCALLRAESFAAVLRAGASQARCNLLLVAEAGVSIERSFVEELARLAPELGSAERPTRYVLKTAPVSFWERLFPMSTSDAAVLVPRGNMLNATARSFPALVRTERPLRRLATTALRPV